MTKPRIQNLSSLYKDLGSRWQKGLQSISFRCAVAIGAILISGHLMMSLLLEKDLPLRMAANDILVPIIDGLATISLFSVAFNIALKPRIRNAWMLVALGMLSYTLADASRSIIEIGLHQHPFPSIADVFYLATYPLVALGIFLMPATPMSRWDKSKTILDIMIISTTTILLYWLFIIGPSIEAGGDFSLSLLISFAYIIYPIMDMVLIFSLIFLLFRKLTPKVDLRAVLLLAVGLLMMITGDAIYVFQAAQNTYITGNLLDTLFLAAIVFYGLAGISQNTRGAGTSPNSQKHEFLLGQTNWFRLLPYVTVGITYAMLVWSYLYRITFLLPVLCSLGGIVLLVLVRQIIVVEENIQLYSSAQKEISDRKNAENYLKKAHDELELQVLERTAELEKAYVDLKEDDEIKSEFILTASHELRTPLTVVSSYIEMFEGGMLGDLTPTQMDKIQVISSQLNHTIKLVEDMLDTSMLELKKLKIYKSPARIEEIAKSVFEDISRLAATQKKTLSLKIETPLPIVDLDERRIKQVFNILLINAIKFTPDGGNIEVRIRDGEFDIRVSISDNGTGIRKEYQDKIFQKFFIGKGRSLIRESQGMGLGLAIAKGIVESHEGNIWVESEYGKGSTFLFTIPKHH
jgi:signal transduction histidine kinase